MPQVFKTNPEEFMLLSTSPLDAMPINRIFQALIDNDVYITENFNNIIGIWQCNWYYDKNIRGYPKGYLCWLNTEEPNEFINKNYDIIQEYTDLRAEVVTKLPDYDATNEVVISAYYNALTGYVDRSNGIVKPLEPIFDIGDYLKGPQLVVSLKDNNKDLVTTVSSWKRLFIEEDNGISTMNRMLDDIIAATLSTHLIEYHLSGYEEQTLSVLSNYFDEFEEKVKINRLPEEFYFTYNDSSNYSKKQCGVDYILSYVVKPYRSNGIVSEYQAMRHWKSGIVEHFGTISKSNSLFLLSDYLIIPFDWKFTETGNTKAYEYGGISKLIGDMLSATETDEEQIAPKNNAIDATYVHKNYRVEKRLNAIPFASKDYSITISPIYQTVSAIVDDFIPPEFGIDALDTNWNNNFITNEIYGEMKTKTFCAVNIADSRIVSPYISYYAVGRGIDI